MGLLAKIGLEPNSGWRRETSVEVRGNVMPRDEVGPPPQAPVEVREWMGASGFRHNWMVPPSRGTDDILAAYVLSPMVRACVQRVVQSYARVKYFVRVRGEEDYRHPVIRKMNAYNPRLIGSQGRRLEQTYLEVCGESITLIHPDGRGDIELWPVPPTWVTMSSKAGRRIYEVNINGRQYEYEDHEVLHRWETDLLNPYGRGRGGALGVADEVEVDEYASRHTKGYFFNSTVPEFIATIKGADEAQARKLKQDYLNKHQGWDKAWQPMFTPYDLDIKELTRKLGDERVEEIRKFNMDVVRWMYGVPPEIVGMVENSNRATIREAKEIMGEFVTDPRCQYYGEVWQHVIAPEVDLGYESPIPKIFGRRDEIMRGTSWNFTRNEFRREAGLKDVPDGDVYVVPVNMAESAASRSLKDCGAETPIRLVEDNCG